jgi:hypothetical protein
MFFIVFCGKGWPMYVFGCVALYLGIEKFKLIKTLVCAEKLHGFVCLLIFQSGLNPDFFF